MGFDLSEFYEIYGHDLEVEAGKSSSGFSRGCWAGCRPGTIPFVPYMTPL